VDLAEIEMYERCGVRPMLALTFLAFVD